jgi:drug/metabolite transporter (DMT)-like permease
LSIWAFQLATFILGLGFLFPLFIWEQAAVPPTTFDAGIVLAILYVGVFASLVAFICWNKAILSVGPSKSGMVYYTLPVFCGVLAFFVLKEEISGIHFFSALLIFTGIITANYDSGLTANKR